MPKDEFLYGLFLSEGIVQIQKNRNASESDQIFMALLDTIVGITLI